MLSKCSSLKFCCLVRGWQTWKRNLLKTLQEKEKMLLTSFFFFSHNVVYPIMEKLHHLSHIKISSHAFNPFQNKTWFLHVCSRSSLKTLRQKEKLLLRAISPFPSVFSTCSESFLPFSSNSKMSSANSFSIDQSKIMLFAKRLSLD